MCLSSTSKQYKETLAREALLLDNLRRQKSSRWYEDDDGFCLSEGLSETTKDFARLMVTSEVAEGDLKSAVVSRLHYSLKREYNVVVECDSPSATVFCMPIGIERRISVNAGNGMCTQISLRKPVIPLHNGYSMHVKGNARTFAFMLLWSNKAHGSITLKLVGDKGPDTAMGGSSTQSTRAVHQKPVRLSSQFEDLPKNMKRVVEFIEKFNKAFEKSQTKSQNAQQQASVPSLYWHMAPEVKPQGTLTCPHVCFASVSVLSSLVSCGSSHGATLLSHETGQKIFFELPSHFAESR